MVPVDAATETHGVDHRLAGVGAGPDQIVDRPHTLDHAPARIDHNLATGRYQSPLRYPGAKSRLANTIMRLVAAAQDSPNLRRTQMLVEPFAGGASVSLRLVGAGTVERVLLADADPLVAQFWQVAAAETGWLIDRMHDEPVTLDRWDHWRTWTPPAGMDPAAARREAAVKCLFLNRTTFSGILHGRAGPLGGRRQTSDYGIDCRFNKDALADRLSFVGDLYDSHRLVDVWCKDWKASLDDVASHYKTLVPDQVVAYLDPPYLNKSPKLYQRSFDPHGGYAPDPDPETGPDTGRDRGPELAWSSAAAHHRLAAYAKTGMAYRWILSYGYHPSLLADHDLYAAGRMTPTAEDRDLRGVRAWYISKRLVSLDYTVAADIGRETSDELLVTTLPYGAVPTDDELRAVPEP